jgi:Ca-activated chloride channel homolog
MKRTIDRRIAGYVLGYVVAAGAAIWGLNACSIAGHDSPGACMPPDAACEGLAATESTGNTGTGGGGGSGAGTMPGGGEGGNGADLPDGGGGEGGKSGDPPPDTGIPEACADEDKGSKVIYMSVDDSNSMASPGHVREIINLGFEPIPSRIRTHEFLNYYRIDYDPAPEGTLSIYPEMEKTPDSLIADFQIGVRSFATPLARRPMNFTFLVDNSGSMKGPGIERARAAVRALASKFIEGDIVNFLSTDSTTPKLKNHTIIQKDDPVLLATVDGLTTTGNTDLEKLLATAYELASNNAQKDNKKWMSRVIFISDGGVNVGITDPKTIADLSDDANREGIYLVGIGTGPALSYNDDLMNEVTEAGRGAYVYIDSAEEAQRVLADRFDETMDIAARSVQVELTLPWYFELSSKAVEKLVVGQKVDGQHLAPNDAMVYFLQTKACDPSMYDRNDDVQIRVLWRTRDAYEPRITKKTVPLNALFGPNNGRIAKARAIVAYAEALKGCGFGKSGQFLCKDEAERKMVTKQKLIEARGLAETAKNGKDDAELDEIIGIINKHTLLQP